MVDGSNESLYHANEEFDPNLCTGVPLQKSLEIVDVYCVLYYTTCRYVWSLSCISEEGLIQVWLLDGSEASFLDKPWCFGRKPLLPGPEISRRHTGSSRTFRFEKYNCVSESIMTKGNWQTNAL